MTRSVSLRALLERPVVVRGIRLGQPTDVVLERGTLRALGLEVRCGDDVTRFLPLPAAQVRDDEIAVGSTLLLFDDQEFYRRNAFDFRSLRGSPVARRGDVLGELSDLVIDAEGVAVEVHVGANGRTSRLPLDPSISIGP